MVGKGIGRTTCLVLAAGLTACLQAPPTLRAQASGPLIRHVPASATDWPLFADDSGWLVGGSGYTADRPPLSGLRPALGIGSLLLPSRRTGTRESWPGELKAPPPPVPATTPLWTSAGPGAAPAAAFPATPWTKMGVTRLSRPLPTPWPAPPWLATDWGPVTLWRPAPGASTLDLGFPPADGTPLAAALSQVFTRRQAGTVAAVLFDFASRTVQPVPSLETLEAADRIKGGGRTVYVFGARPGGPVLVVDTLTGGIDPLPELRSEGDIAYGSPAANGMIVYECGPAGQRQVHLFDRRQRLIDRLGRLNRLPDAAQPSANATVRWIVFSWLNRDQRDLAVYDTLTGQVDPLPEINTAGDEIFPYLDGDGRSILYRTTVEGRVAVRLFDRMTRAIDPLPELNGLGLIINAKMPPDGLVIFARIQTGPDEGRIVAYQRPSGFIDPLPELNEIGADTF
jgi:hypothetical protein